MRLKLYLTSRKQTQQGPICVYYIFLKKERKLKKSENITTKAKYFIWSEPKIRLSDKDDFKSGPAKQGRTIVFYLVYI